MIEDKDEDGRRPLQDEAEAREKWRGRERLLHGSSDETHLPASDTETAGSPDADGAQEPLPGTARPGAFAPPD